MKGNNKYALFLLAAFLFMLVSISHADAAITKWSQLPSLDQGNGYGFSSESQVPSVVADDFFCEDGSPVTGIVWWGSYYDTLHNEVNHYPYPNSDNWGDPDTNPPGIIQGFNIAFYTDVPGGTDTPPWSHPGTKIYEAYLPLGETQVTETSYGEIQRTGGMQTVFQYEVTLTDPFAQQAGTIYWISIQAVDPDGDPLQWGWQESVDHWNDNGVQSGFAQQGWWDLIPDEDLAFELKTVPLPASFMLFGSGLLALLGIRKRK